MDDGQDQITVQLRDIRIKLVLGKLGILVKIWRENEEEPGGGLILHYGK